MDIGSRHLTDIHALRRGKFTTKIDPVSQAQRSKRPVLTWQASARAIAAALPGGLTIDYIARITFGCNIDGITPKQKLAIAA